MIDSEDCWTILDQGIEICEKQYQSNSWESPRRIVVVRQKIKESPQAPGKTLILFVDDEVHRNYRYSAYVTNLEFGAAEYGECTDKEVMPRIESGSRQNSYTGADGGYYINLSNSSARGMNYAVNVPQSGTYTIKFRYSNGGSSSATVAKVVVNGTNAIASLSFPKTTNWNTWNTTSSATISLASAINTIRLETTVNSEFAIIDWLEVTGNSPSTASCSSSGATTSRIIASENTSEVIENMTLEATNSSNPVESIINLVVNSVNIKKANIALIRFHGQIVSSKSIVLNTGQNTINVNDSNLSSGIYFVTIEAEGIQKTIKTIVK